MHDSAVRYAQAAIENTAYSYDKLFTYEIPYKLLNSVKPGMRVKVPFGAGDRPRVALVFSVSDDIPDISGSKAKAILSALDGSPIISEELLDLAVWMKERYFCTLFEAAKLMIPSGINFKLRNSYILSDSFKNFDKEAYKAAQWEIIMLLHNAVKAVSFEKLGEQLGIAENSPELTELLEKGIVQKVNIASVKIKDAVSRMLRPIEEFSGKLTSRQRELYQSLLDTGAVSEKEFRYFTGASSASVKALCEKGAAEAFEYEVYRRPKGIMQKDEKPQNLELSQAQENVYRGLLHQWESSEGSCALLYGITGSGKTSVYMKLIEKVHAEKRGVIVMVPEISLTAQVTTAFTKVFGDEVAVFHSGLSLGERLDEWKRVSRGEAGIVVGTRSAIFAPVKDLGLVVIDEEQEHTYKSESSPRYDAREVARWRCAKAKALCLLSSATPSIESAYAAQKKRYSFYKLDTRYGQADLPQVELVDLSEDSYLQNETVIGARLHSALQENYDNRHQSIILLNRRGYHTFVACKSCKEVVTCPHCSISLTYHSANNRLMCHYCGYSIRFTAKCPACGDESVSTRGVGTQRMEEELARILPDAKVLRLDTDVVSARFGLEKRLEAFSKGEYDIMVGTQMVAKGLDFENVTLVGVISADQMLFSDDFRSNERAFDLLTQVAGRSGRGKFPGKAIIQTYVPGNPYLHLAADQDYFGFYKREIIFRKALLYPPFSDILVFGFVGESEKKVQKAAKALTKALAQLAQNEYSSLPLRILKASPASVSKVSGKYRYRMLIKCRNSKKFREMVHKLLMDFAKNREFNQVTVYADSNPLTII